MMHYFRTCGHCCCRWFGGKHLDAIDLESDRTHLLQSDHPVPRLRLCSARSRPTTPAAADRYHAPSCHKIPHDKHDDVTTHHMSSRLYGGRVSS